MNSMHREWWIRYTRIVILINNFILVQSFSNLESKGWTKEPWVTKSLRLSRAEAHFLIFIQNLFGYKFVKKEIPVNIANRYFIFSDIHSVVVYRFYLIHIDDV